MNYIDVVMRWDTFTFPIKRGTPVSAYGILSNDANAMGIIPDDINVKPVGDKAVVLVGGIVDLKEVEANFGSTINDSALMAMDGICFIKNGTRYPNVYKADYVLPAATTSKLGGVKQAANVADAVGDAPTAAEYKALLDALKAAGIMVADTPTP